MKLTSQVIEVEDVVQKENDSLVKEHEAYKEKLKVAKRRLYDVVDEGLKIVFKAFKYAIHHVELSSIGVQVPRKSWTQRKWFGIVL